MKAKIFTAAFLAAALLALQACSQANELVSDVSQDSTPYSSVQSDEAESNTSDLPAETLTHSQASGLIAADINAVKQFILGEVAAGTELAGGLYDYTPVPADSEYTLFSSVDSYLSSVYTDEAKQKLLSYPDYGPRFIGSENGKTVFCFHYKPEGYAEPDSVSFTLSGDADSAEAEVMAGGKKYKLGFTLTQDGWRLDESLFFIEAASAVYPSWEDSGLKNGQNEGSAARLKGSCLVVNVFLDDTRTAWESTSVDKAVSFVREAADFLASEAASYGSEASFTVTDRRSSLYLKSDEALPSDMEDYLWIDLLFSKTIYGSLDGYVKKFFKTDDYDNYCVLLHVNKKGRSYSLSCNSDYYDHDLYKCERAVMYFSEDKSYSYYARPGTYAHELLHLFGAKDLYGDYISALSLEKITAYFPNAIMSVIKDDIGESGVSPFTAYMVGMTDRLDPMFADIK